MKKVCLSFLLGLVNCIIYAKTDTISVYSKRMNKPIKAANKIAMYITCEATFAVPENVVNGLAVSANNCCNSLI